MWQASQGQKNKQRDMPLGRKVGDAAALGCGPVSGSAVAAGVNLVMGVVRALHVAGQPGTEKQAEGRAARP